MGHQTQRGNRPGITYYIAIPIIGLLSFLVHEFGHWAAGEAVGLDMWMTLNKAGTAPGQSPAQWQQLIIAAAGPLVSVFIALVGYRLAISTGSFLAFGIVFSQMLFRWIAGGITAFGNNPNDEASVGVILGLGPYPITAAVGLLLLWMTWDLARRLRPGWKHILGTYLLSSAVVTAIVMSDNLMRTSDLRLL
jgi:hypothetical protein